jgi:hypothetical protein
MLPPLHDELSRLPDRVRLPLSFEPRLLADDLALYGEDEWINHVIRQNYEGGWSIVPLRGPAGETHPLRMIAADPSARFADTRFLDRAPYLRKVLGSFPCPLKSARLMRLSPGSTIREHCDPGMEAGMGMVRLHIPVATGPLVEFLLNGRAVAMEPGSAWYLRLLDPHAVINRGAADRVHLVVDAEVDDWLAAMLRAGAAGEARTAVPGPSKAGAHAPEMGLKRSAKFAFGGPPA